MTNRDRVDLIANRDFSDNAALEIERRKMKALETIEEWARLNTILWWSLVIGVIGYLLAQGK